MRRVWMALGLLLSGVASAAAETPLEGMIQLTLDGQVVEGRPLAWDSEQVRLLGRDGRLWEFPPQNAHDFRKTSSRFQPYSPSEIRASLLRELGQGFEVSGTEHYLVAHASQQRDQWAQRFEDLYRSFVQYFAVRGFQLQTPPFPLIGIVARNQQEFVRYSARQGLPVSGAVLGWYSNESNRIVLYDEGARTKQGWEENAATLIHETTHQIAFNTGIHNRYSPPPVWVAEGVATLFEAPGIYDARNHPERRERINAGRRQAFQRLVPQHRPELLRELIASDRLFRSSPGAAYAEAWAWTFFLVETEPRRYGEYLARTAAHPSFGEATSDERLADFTAVFGSDWRMLEARLLRFMAEVP